MTPHIDLQLFTALPRKFTIIYTASKKIYNNLQCSHMYLQSFTALPKKFIIIYNAPKYTYNHQQHFHIYTLINSAHKSIFNYLQHSQEYIQSHTISGLPAWPGLKAGSMAWLLAAHGFSMSRPEPSCKAFEGLGPPQPASHNFPCQKPARLEASAHMSNFRPRCIIVKVIIIIIFSAGTCIQ
jgi:hypothetical protein